MPKSKKWRISYLTFLLLVMFFGFPSIAWAYIDPATTSYIIQIVSGLVISLSVAFSVFFRRIQMYAVTAVAKLQALWMRIRSKRHRQMYKLYKQKLKAQPKPKRQPVSLKQFLFAENRQFKTRLTMAGLVSLGLSFTLFLFGPIELFAANREVMPYPLSQIILPIVVLFVIVFLLLSTALLLLRGRVFDVMVTLVFAALLVVYIQGNFMNVGLGQLTGDAVDWSQMQPQIVINSLICLAILAISFLVYRFAKKAWAAIVKFIPALLVTMQLIALLTVLSTSGALNDQPQSTSFLSDQGLYEVSPQHNTLVFLLDRLDQRYIEEVLANEPDFFDKQLDGFTRYTNNLATTSRTYNSVINMLTGANYKYEYPAAEFMSKSWQESEFLPRLRQSGYVSKIYTDYAYAYLDGKDLQAAANNVEADWATIDSINALEKICRLSSYRYAPLLFKSNFWISTEDFSDDVSYRGSNGERYTIDDHRFYQQLLGDGIKLSGQDNPSFSFIHLKGSHPAYDVDYNFNQVDSSESNSYLQTRFAFAIVFEYLAQLKALGLYDDSTIIITGDHGFTINLGSAGDTRDLTEPEVTGLFVKLSGQKNTPLAYSSAPVNSDQLRSTVYEQAGLDYSKLGPTYAEIPENSDRPRYFDYKVGEWLTGNMANNEPAHLQHFVIKGDANDFANWTEIGRSVIVDWYG